MENLQFIQIGFNLLTGLIVAVVTSLITVNLSLKRFYREKWWKLRVKAFTQILNSLYQMKEYCEEWLNASMEDRDMINEQKYKRNWDIGIETIKKEIDIGAFVLSEKANSVIKKLWEELRKAETDDFVGVSVFLCF